MGYDATDGMRDGKAGCLVVCWRFLGGRPIGMAVIQWYVSRRKGRIRVVAVTMQTVGVDESSLRYDAEGAGCGFVILARPFPDFSVFGRPSARAIPLVSTIR
jgi:hypothetical protein